MENIKKKDLIDATYQLITIIDYAFSDLSKEEKQKYHSFFYRIPGFAPEFINTIYHIGLTLSNYERKIFWKNFLIAKTAHKASDADALSFAKLSVIISRPFDFHMNSGWFRIASSDADKSRNETLLTKHRKMIDLAFTLRHLRGANAWVQDLDAVKSLRDDEAQAFEIKDSEAEEVLLYAGSSVFDSYVRLRYTIPELSHKTALDSARRTSKI